MEASVQQISGGIASDIAGMIVLQFDNGLLQGYDMLGYVVICTMLLSTSMMYYINKDVDKQKMDTNPVPAMPIPAVAKTAEQYLVISIKITSFQSSISQV